jgi:hypothetical protein
MTTIYYGFFLTAGADDFKPFFFPEIERVAWSGLSMLKTKIACG